MKQHWKKIVIAVVALAVLVVGGSWVYVEFIKDDPPAKLDASDLDAAVSATTVEAGAPSATETDAAGATEAATSPPPGTPPAASPQPSPAGPAAPPTAPAR